MLAASALLLHQSKHIQLAKDTGDDSRAAGSRPRMQVPVWHLRCVQPQARLAGQLVGHAGVRPPALPLAAEMASSKQASCPAWRPVRFPRTLNVHSIWAPPAAPDFPDDSAPSLLPPAAAKPGTAGQRQDGSTTGSPKPGQPANSPPETLAPESKAFPIAAVAIPVAVLLVAAIAAGIYLVTRKQQQQQQQQQHAGAAYGLGMQPGMAGAPAAAFSGYQLPAAPMPQHTGGGMPQPMRM